jgi:hypothetical protein
LGKPYSAFLLVVVVVLLLLLLMLAVRLELYLLLPACSLHSFCPSTLAPPTESSPQIPPVLLLLLLLLRLHGPLSTRHSPTPRPS